jgi:periplasmic protein TonB
MHSFALADIEGPRLWSVGASLVLFAHVGVALLLMLHLNWTRITSAPPDAAVTLELAPLPTTPPKPPTQIPAGPLRVESQPFPTPVQTRNRLIFAPPKSQHVKLPFESPPEADASDEVPLPKPDAQAPAADARKLPPSPTTTAPLATQSTPAEHLEAPALGSSSNLHSTAEQTWEARIIAQLERYKRYPDQAQRERQTDTVYLDFTMDRAGNVLDFHIERSAGYALLDNEVTALIRRAAPLPPPPKQVPGQRLELMVPVEFFLKK